MSVRTLLVSAAKLLLATLTFSVGMAVNGLVLPLLSLSPPPLPAGVDVRLLGLYSLVGGVFLAGSLAIVSFGLAVGTLSRGLILSFLVYVSLGVNTAVEASIFMTGQSSGRMGVYTAITFLLPSFLCGFTVGALFRGAGSPENLGARLRVFASRGRPEAITGRLLLAVAAFPVVYLFFGAMIASYVMPYYQRGDFGLRIPPWPVLLAVLFLRSTLFLAVCLPVIVAWQKSRLALALSLGLAEAMLVGMYPLFTAFWFPATLRLVHGAEITADSFTYAALLVLLLTRKPAVVAGDRTAAA